MEEKKSIKKQEKLNSLMLAGVALVVIAIVLLIVFFLNGKTDTSGEFPDAEAAVSVTCSSTKAEYPFFTSNEADKRDMNIKVVANGDKINTISLIYYLYFNTEDGIKESRDKNHFGVNKAFEKDGLEPDALGAMYSMLKDSFKFSLFARASDLNDTTIKYFLLNGLEDKDGSFAYSAVRSIYQSQGFTCVEDGE